MTFTFCQEDWFAANTEKTTCLPENLTTWLIAPPAPPPLLPFSPLPTARFPVSSFFFSLFSCSIHLWALSLLCICCVFCLMHYDHLLFAIISCIDSLQLFTRQSITYEFRGTKKPSIQSGKTTSNIRSTHTVKYGKIWEDNTGFPPENLLSLVVGPPGFCKKRMLKVDRNFESMTIMCYCKTFINNTYQHYLTQF